MGDVYAALRKQVPANALRAVDTYAKAVPEYQALAANPDDHARNLEFAVFVRRRFLDLVPNDHPPTGEDLSIVGAFGEQRGRNGVSLTVGRRLLALHTSVSLREIHDACGPTDLDDGLHMLAWLAHQGAIANQAYTAGILKGQQRLLPSIGRVGQFAAMALAGDPAAPTYAETLGIPVRGHLQVIVVRTAPHDEPIGSRSEDILEIAWRCYRAPSIWHQPDEFVALLPANQETPALALAREVAAGTGRPCAAGVAAGPLSTLVDTFGIARRVSHVVPPRTDPDHIYTMADVFIELGVAELPEIGGWLRGLARRLATGPDLIATLDSYYRHDLDRSRTATALNVHPRTLDYRLQKAHELTGVDPRSVNGIRICTTAMTRFGADG